MLRNNADARRCSYFELGQTVISYNIIVILVKNAEWRTKITAYFLFKIKIPKTGLPKQQANAYPYSKTHCECSWSLEW